MINLRTLVVGTLLFCIIVVSGCFGSEAPTPPEPSPTPALPPSPTATATPLPSFGPFIPLGEPVHRNLGTSTEVVRNCVPGAVDPIVKTPGQTIIASQDVEWSVAGTAGIGTSIGGGLLPVEVNLDASLTTTYGQGYSEATERGTGWQLPAKPNTIVTYILAWGEKWQPGFVEVRLWDQPVIKIDVFYRTDVTSEIVAEDVQACDGTPVGEPVPTFTPEVTNTDTSLPTATNTPSPTQSTSVNCDEKGELSFSDLPSAPPFGCILAIEWWYPKETSKGCGLWFDVKSMSFNEGVDGSWWYIPPERVTSHTVEYQAESDNSKCEIRNFAR